MLRFHGLLTGQHLIGITFDCVDLTVMYHKAVRMCSLPTRICVCGESGMNHCDGRFIIRILQVFEKQAQLVYQEHSFVYDGSAGQGYHIGIVVGLFKNTACHIQTAVKVQTFFHVIRTFDECLHNVWHAVYGFLSNDSRISRHFTPCQQLQTLFFYDDFKHLLCLIAL